LIPFAIAPPFTDAVDPHVPRSVPAPVWEAAAGRPARSLRAGGSVRRRRAGRARRTLRGGLAVRQAS